MNYELNASPLNTVPPSKTLRDMARCLTWRSLAVGCLLLTSMHLAHAGSVYAYSFQQISNINFTNANGLGNFAITQNRFATATSTSLNGTGVSFNNNPQTKDTKQAYQGPNGTAPAENSFTPKGQVNPNYARGDVVFTQIENPQNVAESYLANATADTTYSGFGQGGWTESFSFILRGSDTLSLGLKYSNKIELNANAVGAGSLAEGSFSFAASIKAADGSQVFTWSPDALNQTYSLITPDSFSRSVNNLTVSNGTALLPKGDYILTLSGNETVNTALTAVPLPSSVLLLTMGMIGLYRFGYRQ